MLVGSVGGGCGSALLILVAQLLADAQSRSRILAGIEDLVLRRPVIYAAESYAMADRNNEIQPELIYANAFAFRIESSYLSDVGSL